MDSSHDSPRSASASFLHPSMMNRPVLKMMYVHPSFRRIRPENTSGSNVASPPAMVMRRNSVSMSRTRPESEVQTIFRTVGAVNRPTSQNGDSSLFTSEYSASASAMDVMPYMTYLPVRYTVTNPFSDRIKAAGYPFLPNSMHPTDGDSFSRSMR